MLNAMTDKSLSSIALGTGALALAAGCWLLVVPSDGIAQNNQPSQVRGETGYGSSSGSRSEQTDAEYHVVQRGDTLWDLSARFYGDRREWPRLWSYNPHITNPHYIYPGDIVYLSEPPEPKDNQQQADRDNQQTDDGPEPGLHLATGGFIKKDTPAFVGRVTASPKNARLLGQYDTVWVGFGDEGYTQEERNTMNSSEMEDLRDPDSVEKGDRFAVIEPGGELTNDDGDKIGTKYFVVGAISITETSDERFQTAHVDQTWREFQRGAFLVPYGQQLRAVTKVPAEQDLAGKIIDGMPPKLDYGEFDYVFIDRGASDGVRIGNRFFVYQRSEGLTNEWQETPDGVPWQRVGRVRVVDITENFSTAVIVQSDQEFQVGNRVEMYEGN